MASEFVRDPSHLLPTTQQFQTKAYQPTSKRVLDFDCSIILTLSNRFDVFLSDGSFLVKVFSYQLVLSSRQPVFDGRLYDTHRNLTHRLGRVQEIS